MAATQRVLIVVLALLLAACGSTAKPPTPTADPLAGRYSASGGGGALAAVTALTKRFAELHPGVTWQVEEVGSDAGVNLATSGAIDLGFTSRALTTDEATKLSTVGIGLAGTCVIVNSANPVKDLTRDQVKRIFAGDVTNWKQVGGDDLDIKVFVREANAATRSSFEQYFFGGKATYVKDATEVYELEQTLKSVGSFRASIGMATANSRASNEPTVKLVSIDGVAPTPENLVNGSYKIGRPLLLVFPKDESKLRSGIKAFLDFVRSPEGQQIAASAN
ncbi:MAG TPA: phosphate ABC transporter substrate-binding protein [Candidatus Limnocylindria bacterium]